MHIYTPVHITQLYTLHDVLSLSFTIFVVCYCFLDDVLIFIIDMAKEAFFAPRCHIPMGTGPGTSTYDQPKSASLEYEPIATHAFIERSYGPECSNIKQCEW